MKSPDETLKRLTRLEIQVLSFLYKRKSYFIHEEYQDDSLINSVQKLYKEGLILIMDILRYPVAPSPSPFPSSSPVDRKVEIIPLGEALIEFYICKIQHDKNMSSTDEVEIDLCSTKYQKQSPSDHSS
jgi:hypothetical protein